MDVDEPDSSPERADTPRPTRRQWLRKAALGAAGLAAGTGAYSLVEAKLCRALEIELPVRNLPPGWLGARVAFLSDTHHGPFVPLSYLRRVVRMTNALSPDLVLLGGDYVHRHHRYFEAGLDVLGALEAPLGRFGVLGNHDRFHGANLAIRAMEDAGIVPLVNSGRWLSRDGGRLRLGGVDDLWRGMPDLGPALGDSSDRDASVVVSHNPDLVEAISDPRVGLVLSGHTHGGQIYFPGLGAPVVPSAFGQKYLAGFVQGPVAPVFVSRGVGTVTPPSRLFCPPEVALITLTEGAA